MKKFLDKDRPWHKCYDCGMEYKTFQDLSISDELWEKINPTYHEEAGLLCPTCILSRLSELRIKNISSNGIWSI